MGKILAKTRLIFYVLVLLSSSGIYGQTTSKNFITERTYKLTTSAVSDDISTASRQLNYLDGLGRPLQTVSVSSSPETTYNTPSDLIVHTEYDSQGRVSKAIAPYPAVPSILSGSGSFKDDAITKSIGFYNNPANFCNNNDRAYALTEYEASPLNRVRKQYSVGTDKGVEFSYGLNGSEVKRYDVTLNPTTQQEVPTQNGNYAANQLTYVETKDENQNRVREYQDKSGTVVLKRAYNGSEEFSTYYVYDDLSQLRFVLQPMYQDDPSLDKYVFKYTYNSAGLMASKYVPGGGTTTLEYDARDRLIKSTDGRGIVSYTKYDNLNRVIETGHITGTSTENALVKTSYDAYPSGSEAYAQYSSDYPSSVKANVKGQVTAISTRVLASNGTYNTSDVWLANVMYYDERYNVIQTVRNLYDLGGISRERSSRRLRFDGRLEQEFIEQAASTGLNGMEKFFAYDHADRLVSTRYLVKKDGTTKRDITLSANKYDALGQLKTKSLYSAANDGNYREQLDYCFTPRGWLSKVTGKTGGVENFGVELKYNIPTNGATAQYNGNIAEMLWKRGSAWVGYKFAYDGVNRLTNGEGVSGNTNRETISEYDKNGNIKKLQRAFDGVQKDNLTYVYNGNQLTKVTDAENNSEGFNNGSSGTGDDYLYDGNGNATKDANRNIGTNGIVYSVHNLVQQVTIAGGATLTYMYDGAGAKLRMANSNGAVNTKYAGAFEYNQSNYLTRIATEEGQINVTNNGNNFAFEYYLKDHLGNNRMVMSEAGTMTQEMEYFPFGLAIPRTAGTNKYLYNGKEKQPETNWLDYGARMYDPSIARWMAVDPMSGQYESWSPFNYVFNSPINWTDPDGRCPTCKGGDDVYAPGAVVENQYGSWVYKGGGQWETNWVAPPTGPNGQTLASGAVSPVQVEFALLAPASLPFKTGSKLINFGLEALNPVGGFGLAKGGRNLLQSAGEYSLQVLGERSLANTLSKVRFTSKAVEKVVEHLGRFGPDAANAKMVERLRAIAGGTLQATDVDRKFYTHELREMVRMRVSGAANGSVNGNGFNSAAYDAAHGSTLREYGLYVRGYENLLYHPDAIEAAIAADGSFH